MAPLSFCYLSICHEAGPEYPNYISHHPFLIYFLLGSPHRRPEGLKALSLPFFHPLFLSCGIFKAGRLWRCSAYFYHPHPSLTLTTYTPCFVTPSPPLVTPSSGKASCIFYSLDLLFPPDLVAAGCANHPCEGLSPGLFPAWLQLGPVHQSLQESWDYTRQSSYILTLPLPSCVTSALISVSDTGDSNSVNFVGLWLW